MKIAFSTGEYEVSFVSLAIGIALLPEEAVWVTDSNVAARYPKLLRGKVVETVSAGEESKSLKVFSDLQSRLVSRGLGRSATIVAFGGGVVGDLAGFVAATYMRGIRYVQVPSTLVAQVDSSVGGKVGVDLPEGKNLVGAFWPPSHVIIDVDLLKTLPNRHFINGMAEVLKYGFIMAPDVLEKCEGFGAQSSHDRLELVVRRCISLKQSIVEDDERDLTGRRAILNFGHTIGHALEWMTGYQLLLHGEAVAIGMATEARLGEAIGVTEVGTARLVERQLAEHGLPASHTALSDAAKVMEGVRRDKKADGDLAFSLLTSIGGCKLVQNVPESEVIRALSER